MSLSVVATPEESLELLLARCGEGDRNAFRRLYDLQSPRLYGLALRLTRQPPLARDAVHDAFLQVWQKAARFEAARGSAEAWLATLLRYRAIDILRRRSREVRGGEMPEIASDEPDPLALLSQRDDGAALHRCLDALETAQRRVVTLAFIEGLSHPELAARLGAPLGTVKSWVRRALLTLRACLGG